jgi:hypothetical protein
MIINFIILSPLIFLLITISPQLLRFHIINDHVGKIYIMISTFISLIFSIYIFKITWLNKITLSQIGKTEMIPIFWGIVFSRINSAIITAINVSIVILIFLLPKQKFMKNISLITSSFFIILLISTAADQLVKMTLFSIGTLIVTHNFLNKESNPAIIKKIANDFFINRIADFLAFIALFIILIEQKTLLIESLHGLNEEIKIIPRILFYLSIILRMISLSIETVQSISRSHLTIKNFIFHRLLIGTTCPIIFLQFSTAIPGHNIIDIIFQISSSFLLLMVCLAAFFYSDKSKFYDHFSNILSTSAILATCLGYNVIAIIIICCHLIIYSIASLPKLITEQKILFTYSSNKHVYSPFWVTYLNQFSQIPNKISFLLAKFFINFFNPIYLGFILYRMPQILISIVQAPLRLLHNGNIQRSLIFIACIYFGYIYLWGSQ